VRRKGGYGFEGGEQVSSGPPDRRAEKVAELRKTEKGRPETRLSKKRVRKNFSLSQCEGRIKNRGTRGEENKDHNDQKGEGVLKGDRGRRGAHRLKRGKKPWGDVLDRKKLKTRGTVVHPPGENAGLAMPGEGGEKKRCILPSSWGKREGGK